MFLSLREAHVVMSDYCYMMITTHRSSHVTKDVKVHCMGPYTFQTCMSHNCLYHSNMIMQFSAVIANAIRKKIKLLALQYKLQDVDIPLN